VDALDGTAGGGVFGRAGDMAQRNRQRLKGRFGIEAAKFDSVPCG
jgi:hypothetical protein